MLEQQQCAEQLERLADQENTDAAHLEAQARGYQLQYPSLAARRQAAAERLRAQEREHRQRARYLREQASP